MRRGRSWRPGRGVPSPRQGAVLRPSRHGGGDLWRCTNGAKWRSIPAELGPWWKAAQIFIRWARLGVWDRLLTMAQQRGVELGMAFLDGTNIRAHAKAAGASKKGELAEAAAKVRRLGALVAAMAPRP